VFCSALFSAGYKTMYHSATGNTFCVLCIGAHKSDALI